MEHYVHAERLQVKTETISGSIILNDFVVHVACKWDRL
jgi:hypothetical protein